MIKVLKNMIQELEKIEERDGSLRGSIFESIDIVSDILKFKIRKEIFTQNSPDTKTCNYCGVKQTIIKPEDLPVIYYK